MANTNHERVLIIDFGSQVTQLIARRLRENGVYCEIWPFDKADATFLSNYAPKAIILSGGPASATRTDSPRIDKAVFKAGIPILGICYGQQTMMQQLGGAVANAQKREFGRAFIKKCTDDPIVAGLFADGQDEQVWMSHGDHVANLAPGFTAIAHSPDIPYAIIADRKRRFYGTQFHPEVIHTVNGAQILRNFTHDIAGLKGTWTMAAYQKKAVADIRRQIGSKRVICGVSGGVDSVVTALLVHQAVGSQLTCIHVDHGLMRLDESKEVVNLFREHYDIPLIHVDAADLFLKALENIHDPESKRKIIGNLFIDVFESEANKIGGADFLAQGTLYPDVIESVSTIGAPSVTIKSHHNVGGLPERMNMALVEPLRTLFKDEVRTLGRTLGLPETFVSRHPFPGPGLAIRIPGQISRAKADLLRKADAIYIDEIKKAGLYDEIWQAFSVLLPVNTVGVMGDQRTYEATLALRAVTATDGMTADYYRFDHDFLAHTATRIINEVRGINRVVYDITSKPPGTIEWE